MANYHQCPRCGAVSDYNWPLNINGVIKDGGCQECWEAECSREWWKEIKKLDAAGLLPAAEELQETLM